MLFKIRQTRLVASVGANFWVWYTIYSLHGSTTMNDLAEKHMMASVGNTTLCAIARVILFLETVFSNEIFRTKY